MGFLKCLILALAVSQVFGAAVETKVDVVVENPQVIAKNLLSDFNKLTAATKALISTELSAVKKSIVDVYKSNPQPYNPIVEKINTFVALTYKELQDYVAAVIVIINKAVGLVNGEQRLFVNKNANDIIDALNKALQVLLNILNGAAYKVANLTLADFQVLTGAVHKALKNGKKVNINSLVNAIGLENYFNDQVKAVYGNKDQGLVQVDNDIKSLQFAPPPPPPPAPKHCGFFTCVAESVGHFFGSFF